MTRCPSALRLEAYLLDPGVSPLGPHLASCARCQARLEGMRQLGEEFRREVYPATVGALVEGARPRRTARRWLIYLAPLPAAAAAVLFLAVLRQWPRDDYLGTKGGQLALSVFTQTSAGARVVADGEAVPAGAALRFRVRVSSPCRLWLVSIDGAGQVSRLYPAGGEGGAEVAGPGPLPGGAILDGRPGPERLYAVCTRQPLPFQELERAARVVAGGGEKAVRTARALPGLTGALQGTLLLEKRP